MNYPVFKGNSKIKQIKPPISQRTTEQDDIITQTLPRNSPNLRATRRSEQL